jgi:branched-chain amino acid transport system substrate-binding protein
MIAGGFEAECKALKVKVLGHDSINVLARDFTALMAKVKKAEPDAVFFGGTTQSGGPQIAKDFATSGMKCPLIVPDGCYELAFIDATGADNLNGHCYATIGGLDESELKGAGAEFVKRYKEKHKDDPWAYAVYGYEAAAVVLESIRKVGKKDRETIRKAVLATKDFDKGALGKWSFDANGDTTLQQIVVSRIDKGKFRPVKMISAGDK